MRVRREAVRLLQRADADEAHGVAGSGVVAPHGDTAHGATGDLLPLAAVRGRDDDVRLAVEQLDAIGLDHRVERERGA